jgi:hypothetical protein
LQISLLTYTSVRGFDRLSGIDLTSQQRAEIWSRIRAQEAKMNLDKPIGWPCGPFSNTPRVIAYVRNTLVYNGFHPNASFKIINARQIAFQAIRDGVAYGGAIVKSGPHQIATQLLELPTIGHSTGVGSPDRFGVTFTP